MSCSARKHTHTHTQPYNMQCTNHVIKILKPGTLKYSKDERLESPGRNTHRPLPYHAETISKGCIRAYVKVGAPSKNSP